MNKQYKAKLLSIPNFVNTIKLVNWYEPLKSFKNIQNNIKVKLKRYFGKVSNAFSPQGVTFDHASIFDVLGAL